MTASYDVIIIGGRPAGATLAARLARQGARTLLLERAQFPSLPAASSPIIYAPVMHLLDEIGADENEYARGTPRLRRVIGDNSQFKATIPIPLADGRNYAYAIDRARFDAALFENARRQGADVRDGFNVTDLVWDGERVVGVVGQAGKDGVPETLRAEIVVGAEGRFSLVARKTGAATFDEHTANPTSLYYAYWRGVRPYDEDGAAAVAYEGGYGYGFLVMDSADGTTAVTMEGQADLFTPDEEGAEAFYLRLLRSNPKLSARLEGAERITPVQGMKRIGNLYRQPGGAGWALVGDAYHQHDPLDGQGIFNAVYSAKVLAWAYGRFRRGAMTWEQALHEYDEAVRVKTYGMYRRTLNAVQENLYSERQMPGWALSGLRWVMEDPQMHELMGKMFTRQLPPEMISLLTPAVALNAVLRGPLRDLRKRLAGIAS